MAPGSHGQNGVYVTSPAGKGNERDQGHADKLKMKVPIASGRRWRKRGARWEIVQVIPWFSTNQRVFEGFSSRDFNEQLSVE